MTPCDALRGHSITSLIFLPETHLIKRRVGQALTKYKVTCTRPRCLDLSDKERKAIEQSLYEGCRVFRGPGWDLGQDVCRSLVNCIVRILILCVYVCIHGGE